MVREDRFSTRVFFFPPLGSTPSPLSPVFTILLLFLLSVVLVPVSPLPSGLLVRLTGQEP